MAIKIPKVILDLQKKQSEIMENLRKKQEEVDALKLELDKVLKKINTEIQKIK